MDPINLVSIIINNYNYGRFLAEAIDSALNQNHPNIEVIVVDDASTDNSRQVIASYKDKIISILRSTNGKQAAAFNDGFKASKGEIVIFLDSDDYLFPKAVETIVAVWSAKIAKVHYRLEVVDNNRQLLGFSYPQGNQSLASGEIWQTLLECGRYAGTPTSGNAINRKALKQVFPIPEQYKLTGDDYLSTLIPFYGKVVAIEEPLGAYRIHNNNQWALATVDSTRFQKFLRHEQVKYFLLQQKAEELGYEISEKLLKLHSHGRWWVVLASLRLDPKNHPISSEKLLPSIYYGFLSLWKYSNFIWYKRLIYSLWLMWVGFFPLPLAKIAIIWLFVPHKRLKLK